MVSNNNGFADTLKQMKTLLNVNQKVTIEVLEEAANYFAQKLKPKINMSDKNKQTHLRNSIKVTVKDDKVSVEFEDSAWYWHLAEHGHKKSGKRGRVKGIHFVQNTWDAESDKIAKMMREKIIRKMEG